jgi:cell division protein FtsB
MRLEGLERLSDKQKGELVKAISTDIRAYILCLREHIEAGNIDAAQTESFDLVVKLIYGTDVEHRKKLARRVRRLRRQRHWMRREYRTHFRKTAMLAIAYKSKVEGLKTRVEELQTQVTVLQKERDLLRLSSEKKNGREYENENEEGDQELSTEPNGEWEEEGVKQGC